MMQNYIEFAEVIVAAVVALFGVWQAIRARNYRSAGDRLHDALVAATSAIEVQSRIHPNDPKLQALKVKANRLANAFNAEKEGLAVIVEDVEGAIDRLMEAVVDHPTDEQVVAAANEVARNKTIATMSPRPPVRKGTFVLVLVLCMAVMLASGCALFEPTLRPDAALSHVQKNYAYTPELLKATPKLSETVTERIGEDGRVVSRVTETQWGFPPAPSESRFAATEAFADSDTNLETFSNVTGTQTSVKRQTAVDANAYASGAVLQQERTQASIDALSEAIKSAASVAGVYFQEKGTTDRLQIQTELERERIRSETPDEEPVEEPEGVVHE